MLLPLSLCNQSALLRSIEASFTADKSHYTAEHKVDLLSSIAHTSQVALFHIGCMMEEKKRCLFVMQCELVLPLQ